MKKLHECGQPADIDEWMSVIDGIKPFNRPDEVPQTPLVINEVNHSVDTQKISDTISPQELKVGDTSNIDRNTAKKFVTGKYKIDAKIDLHGLSEKNAFIAVKDFVFNCYRQGLRCILIITGKGYKKDDDIWYEGRGIIRESLPSWLNHPDIRPFILSISPAKQTDGGSGAMYVLLKRKRHL